MFVYIPSSNSLKYCQNEVSQQIKCWAKGMMYLYYAR